MNGNRFFGGVDLVSFVGVDCAERTWSDRALVVLVSFRVGFVFKARSLCACLSLRGQVRGIVVCV